MLKAEEWAGAVQESLLTPGQNASHLRGFAGGKCSEIDARDREERMHRRSVIKC